MPSTHYVYRLTLPSGGVVRCRKPDRLAYLSRNVLLFPLLAAALDAAPKPGQSSAATPADGAEVTMVTSVCRAALVDADLDPDDLPYSDRVYLHNWALSPGPGSAVLEPEPIRWTHGDLIPIVRTPTAILVDSVARRYGQMPSAVLGIEHDPDLAFDFDMAIAYRGARMEAGVRPAQPGETLSSQPVGEVTVEDIWGNKHTIPADHLPGVPRDTTSRIHMDDIFRRHGYCTVGVGGDQTGEINVWH